MAPGLRVGWIRTKKENIEKLLAAKESIDLHTLTLNQMIIENYLKDNDLWEHLKKIKFDYKKRAEFMAKCMERYLNNFEFEPATGGMFIYGRFKNQNSMQLAKKCMEHKVAFVPAQVLFAKEKNSNEARFNFSNSNYKQILKGIKMIAEITNNKETDKTVKLENTGKIKREKENLLGGSIWFNIYKNIATQSRHKTIYL